MNQAPSTASAIQVRLWLGLMPHEIFFGLFLLATWLRFVVAEGFVSGDALLYFLCLVLSGAAMIWTRHAGPKLWKARLVCSAPR